MNLGFLRPVFTDIIVGGQGAETSAGWATGSVLQSLRHVVLVTAAGWQVVMALATIGTLGADGWLLATAHVCLGAIALVGLKSALADLLIPVGMAGLGLWGYLASGDITSALVFADCWQINIASGLAALVVLRRYAVVLVVAQALAVSGTVLIVLPSWGAQFPFAVVVTQASIVVAIRIGLPSLFRLASTTDSAVAVAEETTKRARVAKRLSSQIAEESRVLHDTAINTLGAIANGGAGVRDSRRVVEQCESDIALLQALRSEQASLDSTELLDIFALPGLPIVRSGVDDDELTRVQRDLSPRVIDGLVRSIREAVTNATKHSGAEHVEIEVRATEDDLTVIVTDHGVGFAADVARGRGIDNSIRARAVEGGFEVDVRSAPGTGTTVTFVVPRRDTNATPEVHLPPDLQETEAINLRAGALWGLGVSIVSIVLTVIGGTNHHLALYPMIALMLLSWVIARNGGPRVLGAVLPALLTASTVVVFFLSAAATAFGTEGTVHWQALAATGPFVLMLAIRPRRRTVVAAAAVWIVAVISIAIAAGAASIVAAQIVLIAGCVGLGFAAVWSSFQRMVERLSGELIQSRQRDFAAQLSLESDAAAQKSYQRWVNAGLDSAVELLREIADGRDPLDTMTQRDCVAEERYLRQLVQIGPELVHLGREMMPVVHHARMRGVNCVVRLGDEDAPDDETARAIASVAFDSVAATAAGETLFVSLYPVHSGLQLTLVGPTLTLLDGTGQHGRLERLGDRDLLEMTYSLSAPSTSVASTGRNDA